eukprot:403359685
MSSNFLNCSSLFGNGSNSNKVKKSALFNQPENSNYNTNALQSQSQGVGQNNGFMFGNNTNVSPFNNAGNNSNNPYNNLGTLTDSFSAASNASKKSRRSRASVVNTLILNSRSNQSQNTSMITDMRQNTFIQNNITINMNKSYGSNQMKAMHKQLQQYQSNNNGKSPVLKFDNQFLDDDAVMNDGDEIFEFSQQPPRISIDSNGIIGQKQHARQNINEEEFQLDEERKDGKLDYQNNSIDDHRIDSKKRLAEKKGFSKGDILSSNTSNDSRNASDSDGGSISIGMHGNSLGVGVDMIGAHTVDHSQIMGRGSGSNNDPGSQDVSRISNPHKIKKDKILVGGKAHKHIKKDKKGKKSNKDKLKDESLSVNSIMNQSVLQAGPFGPAQILKTFLKDIDKQQTFDSQTMNNAYQCRICLERITNIFTTSDVTSPCKCAGSVKFIHVNCLKQWVKSKGSISCEICHSLYSQQWIEWAFEKNYIKQPDTDNYEDDDDDDGMDLLDKNIDAFKFFFILLSLVCLFFFISSFLVSNSILSNILLDDPLFLTFRGAFMSITIICLYFIYKWRRMINVQDKQANGMNNNLQEQILQVHSGKLLILIEKSRGRGQELLEKLQQNKEEENSSRQLMAGNADFSSRVIQPGDSMSVGGNLPSLGNNHNFNH